MSRSPYAAQARLIEAARTRPELWRLAIGLVMAAGVVVALNTALQGIMLRVQPEFWKTHFAGPGGQGTTPASMLLTLYSFGFLIIGVAVALRVLHQRDLGSLLGPVRLASAQFAMVALILFGLGVVLLVLPPYGMGMELRPNMSLPRWLLLLPLGLFGVLIQSASEEVLFRGYIQQQLAVRFRSPFVWMVLPSALFAVGHYLPAQAGENALLIAVWSGAFGVLMADLTARAGTLGPAIAVHMANNISALLFVALPDSLSGLALYLTPVDMNDTEALRAWLPVEFAMTFVFWLAARLAIRR